MFLFHPNECLDASSGTKPVRRADNPIEYIFADVLRHALKSRNLGVKAVELLDDVTLRANDAGFEFVTMQEYSKLARGYR